MTHRTDELSVHVDRRPDATVLTVHGILDHAHAKTLQHPLDQAVRAAGALVVVDLDRVSFVDSSGLALLVGADHAAREHGGRLRLAGPGRQLRRLLEVTNLDRRLTVRDTLGAALQPE